MTAREFYISPAVRTKSKMRKSIIYCMLLLSILASSLCYMISKPDKILAGIEYDINNSMPTDRLTRLASNSPRDFFEECLSAASDYSAYRCTFVRQEVIDGDAYEDQTIDCVYMAEPFSVRMHWIENPSRADTIVYIENENDGQLLIKPSGGIAQALTGGSVTRAVDHPDVLNSSRRRITDFGFENSIEKILSNLESYNVEFLGTSQFREYDVLVFEMICSGEIEMEYDRCVFFVDRELLVPVNIELYSNGEMLGHYQYYGIQIDDSISRSDFNLE